MNHLPRLDSSQRTKDSRSRKLTHCEVVAGPDRTSQQAAAHALADKLITLPRIGDRLA